jgi:hypothetical protein
VRRIVHLSVTNPSPDSPLGYFRGKAAVERVLAEATPEHAVIRPSLVFGGREEILVNNMAWLLRHLPLYAVPGDGRYRYSPCRWRTSPTWPWPPPGVAARRSVTPSGPRCTRSASSCGC